jgi:thioredoxin reductase
MIVIVGAGPYGLSLASHLAHCKVGHRIFGQPMQFWSKLADAGEDRFLKSFCFGTSIPVPAVSGFSFADYNAPRGLETFEPCSIRNFADYGLWLAEQNVNWVEKVEVISVYRRGRGFCVELASGELVQASCVVVATGLAGYARIPPELLPLAPDLVTHSSAIERFSDFKGAEVAVIGGGQSALEAAALLREAGARPQLFARKSIRWNTRTPRQRGLWQRIRSPLSNLGGGPISWALTTFPGVLRCAPPTARTRIVRRHLPPEGAWWLRNRVEQLIPIHAEASVVKASKVGGRALLTVLNRRQGGEVEIVVDKVVAGTGYDTDIDRLQLLAPDLRSAVDRVEKAAKLDANFESSVPGLFFIGPASAMSFGPLFRFVAGAAYTSNTVSRRLAVGQLKRSAFVPVKNAAWWRGSSGSTG